MAGQWSPIEVKNLVSVNGATFNIGTTRNAYFIAMRGRCHAGVGGESFLARYNGDTAANYREGIHYYIDGGAHNVGIANGNGARLTHDATGVRVKVEHILTRSGAGWVWSSELVQEVESGGAVSWVKSWGRWAFDVAINSIVLSLGIAGVGAGRFTGEVILYSRD